MLVSGVGSVKIYLISLLIIRTIKQEDNTDYKIMAF